MSGYGEWRRINVAKLWSGGLATAVVAGLIVLVGALVMRGVMGVAAPAPEEAGSFGAAGIGLSAVAAAIAALAATGLLHLLLLSAPRPLTFFGWIIGLAVAVATFSPFIQDAAVPSQVATAAINLVTGAAIAMLLASVGAGALPRHLERPRREDGSLPGTGYSAGHYDALHAYPRRDYDGRHRGRDPEEGTHPYLD
ncbi:hypothetical protein HDA32_000412 [Spinactinospora alkalitolerans]|uniref:Uncharacterized protein n=1 Tax=Spinactinospora alkalitolerans TaxID=687207 RepID=A0A852TR44_9ACTN|nr:DUF6069 family protein [Spinactinospora alkalitolerans]NYE45292.1 hypothetical protein [Spinactinospora alkalitolerans]